MSCGCGCNGDASRHFTLPDAATLRGSIGRCLIPVVDRVRDVRVGMGLRPYLVRILRTKWVGGDVRGQGTEHVIHTLTLLPVPKLIDIGSLSEIATPVGIDETGVVMVTEISGAYSEEVLLGRDAEGTPVGPDVNVWYEVEFIRPDGKPGERRRFTIRAAPSYEPEKFQWVVRLERAREGRGLDGTLR